MTNYRIELLKSAKKELSKLPRDVQQRIKDQIDTLQINPYPSGVKKLKNGKGRLRIRIGDYRIIYKVEENILVVLVIKIGHRRQIYRN